MLISKVTAFSLFVKNSINKESKKFLGDISGLIHVGANVGQERRLYNKFGLRVLWIEPIPKVFEQLEKNIKGFPKQEALQALVTDTDGKIYQFNIANNRGESSSILNFKQHKDVWPNVTYTNSISLKGISLSSLLQEQKIDSNAYQALVMDTQGSELLVLEGSIPILKAFKYIKTEVPDFESYEGCCQLSDISTFMEKHGYEELLRSKFATRAEGGNYFDIIYKRKDL